MRISIVGWYGMNNVGDEAFRSVLPLFFGRHKIEFVTPPNVPNKPDIIVLGGGAVASPFYLEVLPPDVPRYAIGIDLAYESEAELLAQAHFKEIYVRNTTDLEAMRGKAGCPVHAMPDLAFLLQPTGNPIIKKYKKFPDKKTVGVFVTDYVNPAIDRPVHEFANRAYSFKTKLAHELDILDNEGWEVMLVPCSTGGYGDDRRINLDLSAFMVSHPTIIFDTISPQDMIDLIAGCNATICQRFHAHIFSIIAGTPFVSIDFTRKVKLLVEENHLQGCSGARFVGDVFECSELRNTLGWACHTENPADFRKVAEGNRHQLLRIIPRVQLGWLPKSPGTSLLYSLFRRA